MMRVAVTGTHGVGKTTLVEELGKRLGFPVISEAARTVIPSFGYSDTDDYIRRADKPRKSLVQSQILLQQMNAENRKVGFLSDRAVINLDEKAAPAGGRLYPTICCGVGAFGGSCVGGSFQALGRPGLRGHGEV